MIILDTNVISDVIGRYPTERVCNWLAAQDPDRVWTTAITAAELRAGASALAEGHRKRQLSEAIEAALRVDFENRILPFDDAASSAYAEISAQRRRSGLSWDHLDLFIASIAAVNNAVVATRNVRDFEGCGVELVDPWAA